MVNLIPTNAQKQIKREYRLRVVTVWAVLLASSFVVIAALTVPLYVLVDSQLEASGLEYEQASLDATAMNEAKEKLVHANETAKLLAQKKTAVPFSNVFDALESLTDSAVSITSVAYTPDVKEGTPQVVIQGVASSRASLADFQTRLESHALFENIVLPLSNLVQDRDITFEISLELTAEPS